MQNGLQGKYHRKDSSHLSATLSDSKNKSVSFQKLLYLLAVSATVDGLINLTAYEEVGNKSLLPFQLKCFRQILQLTVNWFLEFSYAGAWREAAHTTKTAF